MMITAGANMGTIPFFRSAEDVDAIAVLLLLPALCAAIIMATHAEEVKRT